MKDPLLQSLVYVSKFYGLANSPDALISDLPLADGLLTPFLFPRAADKAGLQVTMSKTKVEHLSPLLFPVIALMKDGQSCVVLGCDLEKDTIDIVLPQSEGMEQTTPLADFNNEYMGDVFLVKKKFRYDERSPEVLKTRKGHWFWSTIWQSRSIYRDVLIASILINLFSIAAPLFSRLVYDKIVPNLAFDSLWVLASGILVIFLFDLILKSSRNYFIDIAGKKSDILISSKIFSKVMGIRMEARPPSVGAFAKHMQEFESIREFFTSATVSALIDLPFALLFMFVIWWVAGPLVWVPVAAVTLLILYSILIQRPMRESIEEGSRLAAQKHANLIESLYGLDTVKLFGAQAQFQHRWEEAVAHMANWGLKTRRFSDSVQNTAGFLQQVSSVAMIIGGVYLISEGDLTMGGLIAASMLTAKAIGPLVQLSLLSTRYNQAKSAMTIIDEMMQLPTEQEEDKRYLHRPMIKGKVSFNRVSFKYPNSEHAALRDVSFTVNPGEKVGIIGRIGSGKSTIEHLIMGLYRATEGSVAIDDTDVNQIHHIDVRRNIGCVPQDIMLFFGSIRDNITLGRPLSDDKDVLNAASRAGVTFFTQQDSAGLDRQVGERGAALSGGQRQSVAIARAFLGRPPVLLFDEPTSSMDNRSEGYIKQQLGNMAADETLILITHKTSMLEVVDRLIILEQGSIIADGPKDLVMQKLREGKINTAA
ncbi:type I secretion system permease/ATPase [Thaumasiovibrio subtropicus]|uniref:type I secretion system permease/ATPase n=1 Tax=Thaumasiovibrio subtropicus TaxID=1891207 RepID=UPI000B34F4FD|nr:type I secretion system permease/ATPase [Thaumasiovibrio subtropicus]